MFIESKKPELKRAHSITVTIEHKEVVELLGAFYNAGRDSERITGGAWPVPDASLGASHALAVTVRAFARFGLVPFKRSCDAGLGSLRAFAPYVTATVRQRRMECLSLGVCDSRNA